MEMKLGTKGGKFSSQGGTQVRAGQAPQATRNWGLTFQWALYSGLWLCSHHSQQQSSSSA